MTTALERHLPATMGRSARWAAWTLAATLLCPGTVAAGGDSVPAPLPLEDVSPVFLGIYRKVMVIEDQIHRHADRYGVDFDLARAVCLYESGGNAALNSGAGARGYFQVMPVTFRSLKVASNIEAGVKYLSQMVARFDREDRAVAAYNGGPTRVDRNRGLPLETLQYVLGVGQYRTLLKLHDAEIRRLVSGIGLTRVAAGEDWPALSARLGAQDWELRMHNPFLAQRRLRAGDLIAYPKVPRADLFRAVDGAAEYRMRYGDNYIKLALTLGVQPDALRAANGLWHLQAVPTGTSLRIPLADDRRFLLHAALGLTPPADTPARAVPAARLAKAAAKPAAKPAAAVYHRVARGDTLGRLARRYGTTIGALQRANRLARRTTIRTGQVLRIPPSRR